MSMKLNHGGVLTLARWVATAWLGVAVSVPGAEPAGFQEVFSLIRSNLVGMKEAELDRAAVQGLLQQLQGRVALLTNDAAGAMPKVPENLVAQTNVLDGAFGYVRMERVEKGAAGQLVAAVEKLNAGRRLKGTILDVRFAGGQDYSAAAAAAEKFIVGEKPLLQIEGKVLRSNATNAAVAGPVVVLVNGETTAAAEALAAVLRKANVAVIIGGATPGQAGVFMEYPLKNGQRLRLASGMVRLGDGSALTGAGLKPDIGVDVPAAEERVYLADPYAVSQASGAGATGPAVAGVAPRRRMNEADLVRRQREGRNTDEDEVAAHEGAGVEKGRLVIRDPALARAVDVLKGLVLLKSARAN